MLRFAVPPGYQRQQPIRRPKLGPWLGVIDAILEDDKRRPPKQRHTAKRIFERLKAEHGFTGGYTIVKDYVRSAELHSREMFIPLTQAGGLGGMIAANPRLCVPLQFVQGDVDGLAVGLAYSVVSAD
jgi:hypothetical protein